MSSAPVPLRQIAEAAGVSKMTVSRALRSKSQIAPSTRRRIVALARKFGYSPDPKLAEVMSRLRQSRQPRQREVLAFITAFPTRDSWRSSHSILKIFNGACRHAEGLGYRLEPFSLTDPALSPARLSGILQARGIRGVLVAPVPHADLKLRLKWDLFAAATVGFSLAEPLSRSSSHQWQAMRLALAELTRLGYRRIGAAIPLDISERVNSLWHGAYLLHQQQSGTTLPAFIEARWDRERLAQWINQHRPDAVIGTADALTQLLAIGAKVPATLGFAHINLDGVDSRDRPAGIEHHSDRLGAAAVDLIVEQLHGNQRGLPTYPKVVTIECSWQAGRTLRRQRRTENRAETTRPPRVGRVT